MPILVNYVPSRAYTLTHNCSSLSLLEIQFIRFILSKESGGGL